MTFFFKWGNYGVHLFIWEWDMMTDHGHKTGFRIWWKRTEPRIEETWTFDKGNSRYGNGQASFRWELRKNGKQFDGFYLQGPLVRFGRENGG